MTRRWYLGTMGFGYRDWNGPFYPAETKSRSYLGYYSRFFNAVEIDSTFYGPPSRETVLRWKLQTPEDFQFCLKTPREITHALALKLPESLNAMEIFLERIHHLDDKLGMILLQFPPSFEAGSKPELINFLERLDPRYRFAVEFRHPSWYRSPASQGLAALGVCWAATEYPRLPRRLTPTTGRLYIRWIGKHGSYRRHTHERVDPTPNLLTWKEELNRIVRPKTTIYGFFNNDYAGFAPASCQRFKRLLGLPVEPFTPPQQGRLF